METAKKIAVIVRDRKQEALRMSVGLTVLNDNVTVFIMGSEFSQSDYTNDLIVQNLEALDLMEIPIHTDTEGQPFAYMSRDDMSRALLSFDIVLPY